MLFAHEAQHSFVFSENNIFYIQFSRVPGLIVGIFPYLAFQLGQVGRLHVGGVSNRHHSPIHFSLVGVGKIPVEIAVVDCQLDGLAGDEEQIDPIRTQFSAGEDAADAACCHLFQRDGIGEALVDDGHGSDRLVLYFEILVAKIDVVARVGDFFIYIAIDGEYLLRMSSEHMEA